MYTYIMKFVWDLKKEKINIIKHGVSFQEASDVFIDGKAITEFDNKNSTSEDRFLIIGISKKLNILFVVFVEKFDTEIRIISARRAKPKERNSYEKRIR